MSKKTIVRLIFFIVILASCFIYMYFKDKHYVAIDKQEERRISAIDKYDARKNKVKTENISTDTIPDGNMNGESTVLTNRADFLQKFDDKDIGIAIANNIISSSLKYVNYVIEDCKSSNIKQYYTTNKDTIFVVFGIRTYSEFRSFYNKVKPAGKVSEITIDMDTVEITSNGADFTVLLKGRNKTVLISMEARVPNKIDYKASFYVKNEE